MSIFNILNKQHLYMFNLQYLRYFYDTIRLGGVSQAAAENHVSQSAVSQGIAKLEISLNKPLLIHRRNRIQVTDIGRSVFTQASSIFQAVQSLQASIKAPHEYSGQVVIGCTHSFMQSVLIETIHTLTKKAPKIQIKLRFGHTAQIKKWLKERSIDFGIALDNEDLSAYETTLLYRGKFNLYYNANQPVSDLITEVIFTEPRPEVHTLRKNYHQKYGIELQSLMEVSSWETIATLVCTYSFVGFFPDYLLFHPSRKNHLLPCNLDLPEIPYSIFIVRSRDVPQSPSSLLLLEMMKQMF